MRLKSLTAMIAQDIDGKNWLRLSAVRFEENGINGDQVDVNFFVTDGERERADFTALCTPERVAKLEGGIIEKFGSLDGWQAVPLYNMGSQVKSGIIVRPD